MLDHYGITCTTAPTVEPLTLAEARSFIKQDSTDDDNVISLLIKAAREVCERVTGRALCTQTWRMVLDQFPAWEIWLPKPPLQSISSIIYLDSAGTSTTLSSALYRVDTTSEPGMVEPAYASVWPSTYGVSACVQITFVCGYGLTSAIPPNIKERLLAYVSHRYDRRGEFDLEFCESLFSPLAAGVY